MKNTEICKNCGDDYIPKRRGVQKFCSNSCRSRSWTLKNSLPEVSITGDSLKSQLSAVKSSVKKETISLVAVGNAAAGVAAVDLIKSALTKKENKPATKKDIQDLKELMIGRYLPINNADKDVMGRSAFYDVETGRVVYLNGRL